MVCTQPYGVMECEPGCAGTPHCAHNNQARLAAPWRARTGGGCRRTRPDLCVGRPPSVALADCMSHSSHPAPPPRQVARGITFPLEVFKTRAKGWGVRCAGDLPAGAVLCRYIGLVITDA